MSKQRVEAYVDMPDGFEATGEYRQPNRGEWYLGGDIGGKRDAYHHTTGIVWETFILRKATPPCIKALKQIRCSLSQTNPHSHLIEIADQVLADYEAKP